ncbi:hypothetical protein HJ590_02540 [Naumannella sp. ID2617S]|nr:hypothetical protein [Naumannella sp. ID2617S]
MRIPDQVEHSDGDRDQPAQGRQPDEQPQPEPVPGQRDQQQQHGHRMAGGQPAKKGCPGQRRSRPLP